MNSITAVYGGDTTYGASTSAPFNQTVLLTGTTTSLAASTTTPVYGQPVTFSVTVGNVGAGSGTPSGDVEFYDGTTDIGSATLDDSGDGSLTVSTLTAGPHSITAVYQGDGNFSASTTLPLSLPVTAVATAIELDSPTNTVAPGTAVTLDASVVAAGPGCVTPTGSVQFFDGTTCLGTAALDGWGNATLTVSTLATGAHSITADYCGDLDFAASTSNAIPESVVVPMGTPDPPSDLLGASTPAATSQCSGSLCTSSCATLEIDATNTSNNMPDILPQTGVFNASMAQYTQSIQANPPGKIIVVDDADTGSHGIPDFARGVSGNPYYASDVFVPLVVTLPAGTNLDSTELVFCYSGSDPNNVVNVGTAGSPAYQAAPGSLRIWTENGNVPRNGAGINNGGMYITPNTEFKASLLGWSPVASARRRTCIAVAGRPARRSR